MLEIRVAQEMYFERSFKAVIYSLQAAKLCAFVVTRKIFL